MMCNIYGPNQLVFKCYNKYCNKYLKALFYKLIIYYCQKQFNFAFDVDKLSNCRQIY